VLSLVAAAAARQSDTSDSPLFESPQKPRVSKSRVVPQSLARDSREVTCEPSDVSPEVSYILSALFAPGSNLPFFVNLRPIDLNKDEENQ